MNCEKIVRQVWVLYRYHGVILLIAAVGSIALFGFGNSKAST